jgi:hypothetical protein
MSERITAVFSLPVPEGADPLHPVEFNSPLAQPVLERFRELGALEGEGFAVCVRNAVMARVSGNGWWSYIMQWDRPESEAQS